MLSAEHRTYMVQAFKEIIEKGKAPMEQLRTEVRSMASEARTIRQRGTTAVSLVSTDAGENVIEFNPYFVMPVRVVDSHGQTLFFDVLSPYDDIERLNARQFETNSPLGRLMSDLGVPSLWELSPMIPGPEKDIQDRPPGWIQAYRDLAEWAVLYTYLVSATFASHTLLVRDGFLRTKLFARRLFGRMWDLIEESVREHRKRGRKVMVAGVAKKSKVFDRYRIALSAEGVLVQEGACYLPVTPDMEKRAYVWPDYAPGGTPWSERDFVAGNLYLAKFGPGRYDPIWPVDVWQRHAENGEADEVMGYLLADAQAGFPVVHYPLSLQMAHEQAALTGFDMAVIQDAFKEALAAELPEHAKQFLEFARVMAARDVRRR